jgi:ubiquinone/menaquinone biosynthesis C-methylase UbiE
MKKPGRKLDCASDCRRDSLEHLEKIRLYELAAAQFAIPADSVLLEIGAGTGWQAKNLAERGIRVSAIDVPTSNYRENRVWPVTEYDGSHIPFSDNYFDVLFSSNMVTTQPEKGVKRIYS